MYMLIVSTTFARFPRPLRVSRVGVTYGMPIITREHYFFLGLQKVLVNVYFPRVGDHPKMNQPNFLIGISCFLIRISKVFRGAHEKRTSGLKFSTSPKVEVRIYQIHVPATKSLLSNENGPLVYCRVFVGDEIPASYVGDYHKLL